MTEPTTDNACCATTDNTPATSKSSVPETREESRYETPRVDILEVEDGLRLIAEMPGASPESLDVDLNDGVLTIDAKSAPADASVEAGAAESLLTEYTPRGYFRQFKVSEAIDAEKITAELKDGLLTVDLPRAEKAKPRKIQVGAAA